MAARWVRRPSGQGGLRDVPEAVPGKAVASCVHTLMAPFLVCLHLQKFLCLSFQHNYKNFTFEWI